MKSHQFTNGALALVAMVAMAFGAGCGTADDGAQDLDVGDTALVPEDWGIGRDYGNDWFDDGYSNYGPRTFNASLLGASVVPAYAPYGLESGARGRGYMRFNRRINDCLEDDCARLQFSMCGLDDVSYVDITGLSVHEGAYGDINPAASFEARIDVNSPRRYGVIGGCAGGYLRARTCDDCDLGERFDTLRSHPEDFYYEIRTARHPSGLVRGQLRSYYY